MSAEALRKAAALTRERAEYARDVTGASDWHPYIASMDFPGEWGVRSSGAGVCRNASEEEVKHIASWHPGVALAVAAWLDMTAYEGWTGEALDVARTYLGEE